MTDDEHRPAGGRATAPHGSPAPRGHVVGLGKVLFADTLVPGAASAALLEQRALGVAFSPYRAFGDRGGAPDWLQLTCRSVAPAVTWSWLDGRRGIGHDAVHAAFRALADALPSGGGFVLERAISREDRVAMELVLEGALERELRLGGRIVRPIAGRVRIAMCSIVSLSGGLVVDVRHYLGPHRGDGGDP